MAGEAVELMCPDRECDSILDPAGTVRTKGDVFTRQDALCIAADDYAADVTVLGFVRAPHIIGPKAAVTIVAGQDAYFTAGAPGEFTNLAAGARKCGHFIEAAALSAATVELFFDGYGS